MLRSHTCLLLALPSLLFAAAAPPAAASADRWTSLGPDGGTVQALAADPNTPATLYAGTADGGVWKSTDGGGHWFSWFSWFSAGESRGSGTVLALATVRGAPGTVWVATTGGIFKTADGGATWEKVLSGAATSLAVDPSNPDIVWACTGRVLKTVDGGATWAKVSDLYADRFLLDPVHPATAYASGQFGLFKTTDGGTTWSRLLERRRNTLALDPSDPRVLYASGDPYGVWKSTDGGATWRRLPGLPEDSVKNLYVDPFNPAVLLASLASGPLRRSEDAGETWQPVTALPFLLAYAFESDPFHPGRIWLGTGGQGVLRSLDRGLTWRVTRQGLAASYVGSAAFDPARPRTMYRASGIGGLQRSTDAGKTWTRIDAGPKYGAHIVAPHPLRPGTLFIDSGYGAFRSLDRGDHWSRIAARYPDDHGCFGFDPRQPDTIFAGGRNLLRSRDGGHTWKRLRPPWTGIGTWYEPTIAQIVIAPLRPQTVFVLDVYKRHGVAMSLFRSPDGGISWQLVFDQGPAALAPHPATPGLLYLATEYGGEIWRSTDDGVDWEKIAEGIGGGEIRLTALLVDRLDPSILYLGTDGAGVWRSRDGGITWESLSPRDWWRRASPVWRRPPKIRTTSSPAPRAAG